jgi:large subunit ribosomal protein L21
MEYAVIRTGGKQYKVTPGDVIEVERLKNEAGKTVDFDDVLLVNLNGENHFGFPKVTDALVSGKVVEHMRGEKIRVATFKSKVRYRRVKGHRQELSQVMIESLSLKGQKITKPVEKNAEAKNQEVQAEVKVETVKPTTRTTKKTVKKS